MARLLIVAEAPGNAPVLYQERVAAPLLESSHASAQLIQRIAWAVEDAEQLESADAQTTVLGEPSRPPWLRARR
jgi:hypothetical protein